ncbi:MAG: hypothetical protein U1E37_01665 [Sphingomonadaceae bacterium]
MFTRFNSKFGSTKLDRAVIVSVIAMIGFNLAVLTQQADAAPQYALSQSADAVRA